MLKQYNIPETLDIFTPIEYIPRNPRNILRSNFIPRKQKFCATKAIFLFFYLFLNVFVESKHGLEIFSHERFQTLPSKESFNFV